MKLWKSYFVLSILLPCILYLTSGQSNGLSLLHHRCIVMSSWRDFVRRSIRGWNMGTTRGSVKNFWCMRTTIGCCGSLWSSTIVSQICRVCCSSERASRASYFVTSAYTMPFCHIVLSRCDSSLLCLLCSQRRPCRLCIINLCHDHNKVFDTRQQSCRDLQR